MQTNDINECTMENLYVSEDPALGYIYIVAHKTDIEYPKNRIISVLEDHFGAMPIAAFRKEMELFNPRDVLNALDEIESEGKLGYFVTNTKASWIYLKKPEENKEHITNKYQVSIKTWDSKGNERKIFRYRDVCCDEFIASININETLYLLNRTINDLTRYINGNFKKFGKIVTPDMRYN